ncbi:hypothetical protein CLOM_g8143, partial [Closterium sp. NIES-68]
LLSRRPAPPVPCSPTLLLSRSQALPSTPTSNPRLSRLQSPPFPALIPAFPRSDPRFSPLQSPPFLAQIPTFLRSNPRLSPLRSPPFPAPIPAFPRSGPRLSPLQSPPFPTLIPTGRGVRGECDGGEDGAHCCTHPKRPHDD